MNKESRPPIPEPVRRAVRQKSGFGCVICGLPIYEYDHVIEWSVVQEHTVENLTLLCPNHQTDKTAGRLPVRTLKRAVERPFNKLRSVSSGYRMFAHGPIADVKVGNVLFKFEFEKYPLRKFDVIVINDKTIVGLDNENGSLLLNLNLSSSSGSDVLSVRRGELVVATGVWDYEMIGSSVIVREAPRKIALRLDFKKNGVHISQGRAAYIDKYIDIFPDRFTVMPNNVTIGGIQFRNCPIGISVGSPGGMFSLKQHTFARRE